MCMFFLMSELLDFPVSLDLCNSCDTLPCSFSWPNEYMEVSYFPSVAFLKTGILQNFGDKISMNIALSSTFWHYLL